MAGNTQIEWTDSTWNSRYRVHEDHAWLRLLLCGAVLGALQGCGGHPFENGFDLTLRPERLEQPMHWRAPRRVFVNSMSDLFHTFD